MKYFLIFSTLLFCSKLALAQVSINTTGASSDTSAMLDISSTSRGLLIPRMSSTQMNAIYLPATGLTIYNTDSNTFCFFTGTSWIKMSTINDNAINYKNGSLISKTSGLGGVTGGSDNILLGNQAGLSNNSGIHNIAIGTNTLKLHPNGNNNIAIGNSTMEIATQGNHNIALGTAMASSIEGSHNQAIGNYALDANSGSHNAALGELAGYSNVSGSHNVYLGNQAGSIDSSSTFIGNSAGSHNVFIGSGATASSTNLYNACAIGANAIVNSSNSMVLGHNANIGIGTSAPSEKLEVSGKIKTTNLQITNGAQDQYVLKSNANGDAIWADPSTLPNGFWAKNGNSQYSAVNGNVGINVTNPQAELDISGVPYGSSAILLRAGNSSNSTAHNQIEFGYDGQANYKHAIKSRHNGSGDANNALDFYIWNHNTDAVDNTGSKQVMTISGEDNSGRVGIGTNAPSATLDVIGTIKSNQLQLSNGANNGYILQSDLNGNAIWSDPLSIPNGNWTTNGTNQYSLVSGNIGIGTTTPTEKLDVNGKTKTTNFAMTNGAQPLYLLTCADANGTASWIDPNLMFNNIWTSFGVNSYLNKSGNLGIGTFTPEQKVHVTENIKVEGIIGAGNVDYYNPENSIICAAKSSAEGGQIQLSSGSIGHDVAYYIDNYQDNFRIMSGTDSSSQTVRLFLNEAGNMGIGTSNPNATFSIRGSESHKVNFYSSSNNTIDLNSADFYCIIFTGATTGNTIVLPDANVNYAGKEYILINHSTGNIDLTNEVIYNSNTGTHTNLGAGSRLHIICDSSKWHRIN
jgi:hypothetical protein